MPEISKHPVNNIHRTSDSMQSAYLSHNLGNTSVPASRTPPVILTVVSMNKDTIVVQEQSSRKNLQIVKGDIKGINFNSVAKGDHLVLLSNDSKTATFELKKQASTAQQSVRIINSGLADALKKVWPDISSDILRKLSPDVLSSIRFEAESELGIKFSEALVKLAKINQQPLLDVKFSATVKQITNNSIILNIGLASRLVSAKSIELPLPLTTELKQKIGVNSNLEIQLNATSEKKNIVSIINRNSNNSASSISNQGILELNKIVNNQSRFKSALDSLISNLLLSNSNIKHHDIIIEGSKQNINRLPATVQQALNEQSENKPYNKQESQLIIRPKLISSSSNVELSWLAKPQILRIDTSVLSGLIESFSSNKSGSKTLDNIVLSDKNNVEFKNSETPEQLSKTSSDSLIKRFLSDKTQIINNSDLQQLVKYIANNSSQPDSDIKLDINLGQNKKALLEAVAQIINQEQRSAISQNEKSPPSLHKILNQLLQVKQQASPELKVILKNALPALNKLEQVNANDANQVISEFISPKAIKEVLSESTTHSLISNKTNNAVLQLLNQSTSSSMINGLVKILTTSLLAKLNLPPSELGSYLLSISNTGHSGKKSAENKNPTGTVKAIQELNRLDPQGRLFNQINSLLNKHRYQKLNSIESSIQGNESLQYSFPNPLTPDSNEIQIIIKKEQEQKKNDGKEEIQTNWHLNMKLSVGDYGEALASVKLNNQDISLNFYASNTKLKTRIEKYLPLLNQRLQSAGLKIRSDCFVGNIPETIFKTNLQMVHTYA